MGLLSYRQWHLVPPVDIPPLPICCSGEHGGNKNLERRTHSVLHGGGLKRFLLKVPYGWDLET